MKAVLFVIMSFFTFKTQAQELVWFQSYNGKQGLKDKNDNEVVPAKYDNIRFFFEGYAAFRIGQQWGFLNSKGKEAIPAKYEDVGNFSEGLAYVEMNNKFGFINTTGALAIPAKFEGTGNFSEGLAPFKKGNKWGYIDKTGKTIIAPQFSEAYDFLMGEAKVYIGNKKVTIDRTGKTVVAKALTPFEDKDGLWGYKTEYGDIVVKPKYNWAENFSGGLAIVVKTVYYDAGGENFCGIIDSTGKEIVPLEWQKIKPFKEGIAAVMKDGSFNDGWATFLDGKSGFIDKKGKLLFPLIQCHKIEGDGEDFKRYGKVKVYTDEDNFYYINRKGEKIN